jgi:hypothetical protein
MTRIKWADMEMVGDQSSYVNAVQGELAEVLLLCIVYVN